jgi:hypothetical protein
MTTGDGAAEGEANAVDRARSRTRTAPPWCGHGWADGDNPSLSAAVTRRQDTERLCRPRRQRTSARLDLLAGQRSRGDAGEGAYQRRSAPDRSKCRTAAGVAGEAGRRRLIRCANMRVGTSYELATQPRPTEWLRAAELATAAGALSSGESSDLLPVIQRA